MHSVFPSPPANDRIRIEIRRGCEPAIGFDVWVSSGSGYGEGLAWILTSDVFISVHHHNVPDNDY